MNSKHDPSNPERPASVASLVAFLRTAELGSFAAAARHLDMSAAAVGQAVQRLEARFGVQLLKRSTRRMSLTPDGRLLVKRSQHLLAGLEELDRIFEESRGRIAGPLSVSAPVGIARRHVVPLIAKFVATHPGVQVSLDCSDTVRDLINDPVDVAIRIQRPTDSSLVARKIAALQAVTLASPQYLRDHGTPKQPSDLADHACIAYRHPATGRVEPLTFRVNDRDVVVRARPAFEVNDVEAACEAAVHGLGIVQPPSDYAEPYLTAGRLISLLDGFRTSPWTLYLCYPAAARPLRVRAFIAFARAELRPNTFII